MAANDNKPFLGYLNKLVDKYNNIYDHSIGKKPVDADYSPLNEEIKFKVGDRVRIAKYENVFRKYYTKNWLKETFITDYVLKSNF